jgi:hypothetical protein
MRLERQRLTRMRLNGRLKYKRSDCTIQRLDFFFLITFYGLRRGL